MSVQTRLKNSITIMLLITGPAVHAVTDAGTNGVDQAIAAAQQQLEASSNRPANETRITIKRPDSRLTLKTCSHTPTVKSTPPSPQVGKVTMKVHCAQPAEWSIYLPAVIHQQVKLWTSQRNINRGEVIVAADLKSNLHWLVEPPAGAAQDREKIVGMETRQSIQSGRVIKHRQLKKPLMVRKGQRLSVAVMEPGFTLSTDVIALEDAADGATIKVRNAKTEKLLWARVSHEGNRIVN